MKDDIIKTEMKVGEHIVGVMNVNGSEYISLQTPVWIAKSEKKERSGYRTPLKIRREIELSIAVNVSAVGINGKS